jgi:protein SERAC1
MPHQALDRSDRIRDSQPQFGRILPATRGIIFLGTPHRGSDIVSLAKVVAFIAQVTLHNTSDKLIRDLERDSEVLDRIRDNFSHILDRRTFSVWSFIEELPTIGSRKARMPVCVSLCLSDVSLRLDCVWRFGPNR